MFVDRYQLISSLDSLEEDIFPKRIDINRIEHENVLAVATPIRRVLIDGVGFVLYRGYQKVSRRRENIVRKVKAKLTSHRSTTVEPNECVPLNSTSTRYRVAGRERKV